MDIIYSDFVDADSNGEYPSVEYVDESKEVYFGWDG